jgi:phosphoglycerate dehydrogenase-like enzyme
MRVVFHGDNAAAFREGFEVAVGLPCKIQVLSDALSEPGEREAYEAAEVVVCAALNSSLPVNRAARLFHVAGAGWNAIDVSLLPQGASLCNCHGHEAPIAEYAFAGILNFRIPFAEADAELRRGDWRHQSGRAGAPTHEEIFGTTLGLLGYGHIGRALAERAHAFGMTVHAVNRSDVSADQLVDRYWPLDQVPAFCAGVDALVASMPLTAETTGLLDAAAIAALPPHAVVVNVGRGPVIEENALYDALAERRIRGAVLDTWWVYPGDETDPTPSLPANLPFHQLENVVMTPHMSGWVSGTLHRRRQLIADNVARLIRGESLFNVVAEGSD